MKHVIGSFLLLWLGTSLHAQLSVQNNGNLQVFSGGKLAIIGDFTNASTASLVNNGSLYFSKGISNAQSGMSAGTGTVYFNGAAAQTVTGTQAFKVYNFNTDNTAGITLNTDLSVSGTHTFANGLIQTGTGNFLVYEAGSSYTGDNDTRHVTGTVKKIGNTDFVFPVGSATYERSIALSGLTLSSTFTASYLTSTPNATQIQPPLVNMDIQEYWPVIRVSGSSGILTLNWNTAKVPFPNWGLTEIKVALWNGSQWVSQGGTATGSAATSGTVASGTMGSFNLVAFGSTSFPLPLTLLQFSGKQESGYNRLNWKTANEQNVKQFQLEKSADGISFLPFAWKPARNSGLDELYEEKDPAPCKGQTFYRLRSVDHDGKQKLSGTIRIATNETKGELTLIANPVHDAIQLVSSGEWTGSFDYSLQGTSGQVVSKGKLSLLNGQVTGIQLPSGLTKGNYILSVTNGLRHQSLKILVQ
ncbi:MAG TPA: hypothetical protein VHK91_10370 [Flavisolibacter sp.]|jgi:hypothetical protein|nr:hypothetical protein [Flavisolibacter sp.]